MLPYAPYIAVVLVGLAVLYAVTAWAILRVWLRTRALIRRLDAHAERVRETMEAKRDD